MPDRDPAAVAEPQTASDETVELLVAPEPDLSFPDQLERLAAERCLRPFSDEAEAFMADVSRTILRTRSMAGNPELMAMAFSLRPAEVAKLRQQFELRSTGRVRRGVGLAFHIAPANVDTLFVYSWFLSLLAGNPNLVRVSGRRGEAVRRLLDVLAEVLAKPEHAAVRARSLVVSYGRADAITTAISARCRLRIIWGGDGTVKHLRSLPLEPRAREVAFADRFSLAVFRASAVAETSDEEIGQLTYHFANDALWFEQNACSSPRAIFWLGDAATAARGQRRFWPAVEGHLERARWELAPATMVGRLTSVQMLAAEGLATHVEGDVSARGILRLSMTELDEHGRTSHPAGGVFYEYVAPSLATIDELLTPRDQTMTVYGLAHDELAEWIETRLGDGVDRIVPVGRALDFDAVWDGQDLFDPFTDEVTLDAGE